MSPIEPNGLTVHVSRYVQPGKAHVLGSRIVCSPEWWFRTRSWMWFQTASSLRELRGPVVHGVFPDTIGALW